MNTDNWLTTAQKKLTQSGAQTARLDCLVLLEDALARDRAWILANPEVELSAQQIATLSAQLARREEHVPLAYIRGKAEFYGRNFVVNERVLVPRPESETIIELLKELTPPNARIADIGTGSGALAVTAALELPTATVAAVDIDKACLDVALRNATVYGVDIELVQGNLLVPFIDKAQNFKPSVLLCNLPYVPEDYPINDAAAHEPKLALFGGADGLNLFRTLFMQAEALQPELILTESLPTQHNELTTIATAHGYTLERTDDFIQAFRRSN